jgi:hypothetical protein
MQVLQQTDGSSIVFHSFSLPFQTLNFEDEVSDYIGRERSLNFVDEVNLQRKSVETSAILRVIEDIKLLKDSYIFKQAKGIESYLWNNGFLLDILFEAYNQIMKIFDKGIELHLELHRDYEEDFEELFVVIKSSLEPEQMLVLMDKLDEEWFLGIMDTTKGKLNITVEPL